MAIHYGSCHCQAIRFKVAVDLSIVTRCTCSICTKKGILLARVEPEDLKIIKGAERLKLYQFNKKIAKHFFCPNCGIQILGHPRTAPDKFIINVNTLDDYDIHTEMPTVRVFDGRNWEEAFAKSVTWRQ